MWFIFDWKYGYQTCRYGQTSLLQDFNNSLDTPEHPDWEWKFWGNKGLSLVPGSLWTSRGDRLRATLEKSQCLVFMGQPACSSVHTCIPKASSLSGPGRWVQMAVPSGSQPQLSIPYPMGWGGRFQISLGHFHGKDSLTSSSFQIFHFFLSQKRRPRFAQREGHILPAGDSFWMIFSSPFSPPCHLYLLTGSEKGFSGPLYGSS